jgi:ABC-type transport system involved in cytochrome c biogenesis permease component
MNVAKHLDEALRVIELRRYKRLLLEGRLPAVYSIGVLLVTWMLVPFIFGSGGLMSNSDSIFEYEGWFPGALFTTTALAAMLAGYFRSQRLWNQEHRLHAFTHWIMTRQSPIRVAVTSAAMATVLGLGMVAVPAALALCIGTFTGMSWWQILLSTLLLVCCSLFGAALGTCVFFVSRSLAPRGLLYAGLTLVLLLSVGLWLRVENVEKGWKRSWEERPGRVSRAIALVTPAPAVFGVAAPEWWKTHPAKNLGLERSLPAWGGGLLYSAFLLAGAALCTALGALGYRKVAAEPDLLSERPKAPTEEAGEEFYWKGFRNPVLTRDIRTRLRSRDTAEFIFFASVAVAAGAFIPLLMTAKDLADPQETARAARHVFFWLTMTLVSLVALVTPGLTADVIVQERESGTLEMLIGTPLRPREILLGKLLGAVCVMLLLISPSLPLYGLCYLFHGASEAQVMAVYSLLVLTLVVSAFIGLAQSSTHAKSGVAKFWAYALTLAFVAFPGGPFWVAAAAAAPDAGLRKALTDQGHVTAVVAVLGGFFLALLWGNASEQLEYSEY